MTNLDAFQDPGIRYVFTDIDDTLTDDGRLSAEAYAALWKFHEAGYFLIPVTGRPAGWCELIARLWPVNAVVGENGAFYFRYDTDQRTMKREFIYDTATRERYRKQLDTICKEVLKTVPGADVASDQFCRLFDLAIDFCEDVDPLSNEDVQKIVGVFHQHGANAKVSSIHVNGWFGDHDKLQMTRHLLKKEWDLNLDEEQHQLAFIGDSPNDEPLFQAFQNSFGVANINGQDLKHPPKVVTPSRGGQGFVEFAKKLVHEAN